MPQWNDWNVNKKGYGLPFLMKVLRKCNKVIDSTGIEEFYQLDEHIEKNHISYSERYLQPFVDNKTKGIIIQSQMGTGKTTQLIHFSEYKKT